MYKHTHTYIYTHTKEYYSTMRKNMLTFATTLTDHEGIMLSGKIQKKSTYMWAYAVQIPIVQGSTIIYTSTLGNY